LGKIDIFPKTPAGRGYGTVFHEGIRFLATKKLATFSGA